MAKLFEVAAMLAAAAFMTVWPAPPTRAGSAWDFAFTAIEGGPLKLADYRGRAVLVVNTASQCGFTKQYAGLQSLWARYRDRGLVVLGVPSNDFGGQEPGSEAEIKKFCEINFDIDFPLAGKEKVVGAEAHPFYRWVATELGAAHAPRWNFYKYLIAPDGALVGAWPSTVEPLSARVTEAVDKALATR